MDDVLLDLRTRPQRTRRTRLPAHRTVSIAAAILTAAVFGACTGESPTEILPSAADAAPSTKIKLEYLGKAIAGEEAKAPEAEPGTYPGFDTNEYPGDDVMKKWLDAGPYRWVGYYLPAPCHKDQSWMGKRRFLEDMGWGLAVIYVGQQTWDQSIAVRPRVDPVSVPLDKCGRELVSGPRGRLEGDDAIRRTRAEGFPAGSVIFLDIERMETMPPRMRAFYIEWTRRVVEEGTYRPGYYAHAHNANAIYGDVRTLLDAMGQKSFEPPFWISSAARAKAFSISKAPEDVGHAFAHVWQGMIDIIEGRGGVRLPIDVNVARTPNPSMPVPMR